MAPVITASPACKSPEITCVMLPSLKPTMTSRGLSVSPSGTHTRPGRGVDDKLTGDQDPAVDASGPKEALPCDDAEALARTGAG